MKKGDNLVENVGITVLLTSGYSHNSCNLLILLFFVRQFVHFDNVGHKAKCCGCFDNQENKNKK